DTGTGPPLADLLHLEALVHDANGVANQARDLYRATVAHAKNALTPVTQVLALRNLGAALCHGLPEGSVGLYRLALRVLDASQLDERNRPSILNALAYALVASGDPAAGLATADDAIRLASAAGHDRITAMARFNRAIALELCGDICAAEAQLADLTEGIREVPEVLVGWALLRRSWLALKRGDIDRARHLLLENAAALGRPDFADTLATLEALAAVRSGDFSAAREHLVALHDRYKATGDDVTTTVLSLWIVCMFHFAGRDEAARRVLRCAAAESARIAFRVSPNWWSNALVDAAQSVAGESEALFVSRLYRQPADDSLIPPRPTITLKADGSATIAGGAVDEAVWRQGKAGARVLRHYLAELLTAHPAPIGRDELAERMWPDSDGDRAVRNLYAATNDLRAVLSALPGVRLRVEAGQYRLAL